MIDSILFYLQRIFNFFCFLKDFLILDNVANYANYVADFIHLFYLPFQQLTRFDISFYETKVNFKLNFISDFIFFRPW